MQSSEITPRKDLSGGTRSGSQRREDGGDLEWQCAAKCLATGFLAGEDGGGERAFYV